MTDVSKWDHKDEWHRHGKDFLVVVKRYAVEPSSFDPYEGTHRWAVYAYVYPKHRLFGNFSGPDMWQPAAAALPLHGGPSLLRWHYADDGKPTSVQIGADYHHLHDTHFSGYATADDAYEVFADAEQLFGHLAEMVGLGAWLPAATAPEDGTHFSAMRKVRDDLGLKRLELYAHPDDWPAIKQFAIKMQLKRTRALAKQLAA